MGTGFLEEVPEWTPHTEPHGSTESDLGREQLELGCEVGGRVGAQGGWSHREGEAGGWWIWGTGTPTMPRSQREPLRNCGRSCGLTCRSSVGWVMH